MAVFFGDAAAMCETVPPIPTGASMERFTVDTTGAAADVKLA